MSFSRIIIPSVLLAALTLTCCTGEQLADCPREAEIAIEVFNAEGDDITEEGAVETLSLYIFDNRKRFLKVVEAQVSESLRLYFPDQDTLNVVSWGNLGAHQQLPELVVGTPMHEAVIRLHPVATRSPVAQAPDDLFYSYNEISLKSGTTKTVTLKMERTVASMAVVMRNLQSYANEYNENYSIVVRDTYNAIDFYRRLTGEKVSYRPATHFNADKELVAPLFNLLPTDEAGGVIEIDIYHGDTFLTTVKNDNEGIPLRAVRGKVLNVLVDFRMQVSVSVSLTPWGETKVWKDF